MTTVDTAADDIADAVPKTKNIEVQKITVANQAGFVLRFDVKYKESNGTKGTCGEHGYFPIDQSGTLDLKEAQNLPEGCTIWPKVYAELGDTENADHSVIFRKNGADATYTVQGTTLNYTVKLND
jgi:hypothetical protein